MVVFGDRMEAKKGLPSNSILRPSMPLFLILKEKKELPPLEPKLIEEQKQKIFYKNFIPEPLWKEWKSCPVWEFFLFRK